MYGAVRLSQVLSWFLLCLPLHPGPEISSRPVVRDDHTKRPDDYENNYSRPMDDHVLLENLSQFLGNPFCLHLSKYNNDTDQSTFTCSYGLNSVIFHYVGICSVLHYTYCHTMYVHA